MGPAYDVALTGRGLSAASALASGARPPATALVRAVFVAPRAPRRLADPGRPPVELVVVLASAVGLALIGHVLTAVTYAVLAVCGLTSRIGAAAVAG